LKPKLLSHTSRLGWNNAARTPLTGSIPDRLGPFRRLQRSHASATLSGISRPPCRLATMCSVWWSDPLCRCRRRQYSQRFPARWRTNSRAPASIANYRYIPIAAGP
jgi:hypothetical protein